jgi:hypothetical protein
MNRRERRKTARIGDAYVMYAFAPDDIASFQPKPHQTRTQEAKQLAFKMLRDIREGGTPARCNSCESDVDPPAALIVMVPENSKLQLVGGWLCQHCLDSGDVQKIGLSFRKP